MGCVESKKNPAKAAKDLVAAKDTEADPGAKAETVDKAQEASATEGSPMEVPEGELYNEALIFIKPHAATAKAKAFVEDFLDSHNIEVLSEGEWTGPEIDKRGIIDDHYAHIAKVAMRASPADLPVSDDKKELFRTKFGESWEEAIEDGRLVNLKTFEDQFEDITREDINVMWGSQDVEKVKLAPGTYVGYFPDQDRFVMNPFYANMRAVYTDPEAVVTYFVVRFPEDAISWKAFRGKIIGATDPTKASGNSLRAAMLENYEDLGLLSPPNVSDNGVHASAGPFEGLKERMVWTGATIETDGFGKALIDAGVNRTLLDSWLDNKLVTINGETDHAFDLLEEIDSSTGIDLAVQASKSSKL